MTLEIAEVGDGTIVVAEPGAGHRFTFKLATLRGAQAIEAMRPEWAGGTEPPGGTGLARQARTLAETEARDRGWIEGDDPDVG